MPQHSDFQFEEKLYKQLNERAVGSPLSLIMADTVLKKDIYDILNILLIP